jgi:succinate dehydrogenase/fumarate reductase iron-sulfur protein
MTETIKIKVYRFNPKKDTEPHYETYDIPFVEGMSVRNALDYIRDNIDGSLAYYISCRIGKCLGCVATIDGKNKLICTTVFKPDMTIEPLKGREVIKDLVTMPPAR